MASKHEILMRMHLLELFGDTAGQDVRRKRMQEIEQEIRTEDPAWAAYVDGTSDELAEKPAQKLKK